MLRTLRLSFSDRPDYELAFEPDDETTDPWEMLEARTDPAGRIVLGDREWCTIDEVLDVMVVEPERMEGPTWERGLRDEDVATQFDENYDPPA